MPTVRTLQRSFGGGELTPEMFGRIDDAKYQTGLALCQNFIILPHGPASNRPGTTFVREVKTSAKKTRLIPFSYSTTQTMVLEFGDQYIRFHTQGATLFSGGSPYEVATPYLEADLFDLHYVQSADVLTICHPNYAPRELRRLGATSWTLSTISFGGSMSAPTSVTATPTRGLTLKITAITKANPGVITTASVHSLAVGSSVYIADVGGMTQLTTGYYVVNTVPTTSSLSIKSFDGGVPIDTTAYTTFTTGGTVAPMSRSSSNTQKYKITAIGDSGLDESLPSALASCVNNLLVDGAYNTITWAAVAGAVRYNVYKESSGLYGYIGQADGTSFTDDNIVPDFGTTPPIGSTPFSGANNYPGAVSYFEQRRVFAGTINQPQNIWMTRSGTESNLAYSLPTKDDDAINFRVAAREANTIRHVVPLTNLVLLTSSAEWRITSVNSDAITPTTVSVRPQSYIGASNVQPVIINNTLIYAAARGGHMRELAYSWQASGYVTGDLCLRAPHLFDGYTISDLAYSKAPTPTVWTVSSTGKLLGLTYVPEQQIGSWHQHTTDGAFESCCVVAEGNEDVLYVVTQRTINGNSVRYVERMASRLFLDPADAFFVDCGATYNGANTSATTVTVSGGTTWGPADTLTITASAALFAYPATTDVNDAIVLTDAAGQKYRLTIKATSSTTVATAKVDLVLPASLRSTAISSYVFARDSVAGLSWLEGKTVNILADGAVHPQRTVTSGAIQLDRAYGKVQVGLPIQANAQTLPWAAQLDAAFGQGRYKNVNKVWLRVYRSSGIFVGPDPDNLVEAKQRTNEPYGTPPTLKSEEIALVISPTWDDAGQVYIRQSDPLPLTLVSMSMDVAIGG